MKYAFLVLYIVLLVVVSFVASKKVKNLDDFHLGGRSIGPWLSAFAYGTAYFSAVIFIGYAGKLGWNFGLAATWIGIGNAFIGSYLAWRILGPGTRRMTQRLNVGTMPELFAARYGSKGLKIVTAAVIFIFLTPYSASVYQGLAYLFEGAFNIPFEYCMIGMAVLTAVYLLAGGYFATVLTDLVQGIFMIVGVVAMIFCLLNSFGGGAEAISKLAAIAPQNVTILGPDPLNLFWLFMLTSLGVWGLPQMVHKFYAIRSDKAIKTGAIVSTAFAVIVGCAAYFAGAFGRVAFTEVPIDPATMAANYDMIMPQMLMNTMPELVLGLIVVLVLSASMSTLSSLVLASASTISIDLIRGVFFPQMSDKQTKRVMQVFCLLFIAISVVIALGKNNAIVNMMAFSWGTVAGCCLGPYVFGVLWKGATRAGAWAGVIAGVGVSLVLAFILGPGQAPFSGCMAMFASLLAVPAVSLFTKKTPAQQLDAAFGTGE